MFTAVHGLAIGSVVKWRTRRALRAEVAVIPAEKAAEPLLEIHAGYSDFPRAAQMTAGRQTPTTPNKVRLTLFNHHD